MASYVLSKSGKLTKKSTGESVNVSRGGNLSKAISKIPSNKKSSSRSSSSRSSRSSSKSSSSSSNSSKKKQSRYQVKGNYMVDTQTGNKKKLKNKSTGSYNDAALALQKEASKSKSNNV